MKVGHQTARSVAASSGNWTVFWQSSWPDLELAYLVARASILHAVCMVLILDVPSPFPCILFRISQCLHAILEAMKLIV